MSQDPATMRKRNLITAALLTLFFVTLIVIAIYSTLNPS